MDLVLLKRHEIIRRREITSLLSILYLKLFLPAVIKSKNMSKNLIMSKYLCCSAKCLHELVAIEPVSAGLQPATI